MGEIRHLTNQITVSLHDVILGPKAKERELEDLPGLHIAPHEEAAIPSPL